MEPWIDILKQFGLPAALIAFFVWRDAKREDSMVEAIKAERVAAEVKNAKMIELVERGQDAQVKSAEAQMKMAAALVENTAVMSELKEMIHDLNRK